ncbi:MAG: hypothetical protein JWQ71_566 [Pedosphaera sp.]|nr:hypothetical protein [Pedosphaera sp.]
MIVKHCLSHLGKETFAVELLAELNNAIRVSADEFPLRKLASPGWCPSTESQARIEKLESLVVREELVEGSFVVSFQEFMQRDCQDVMTEGRHSGKMNFRLNVATGEIEFSAEQYPVREFDPEEF